MNSNLQVQSYLAGVIAEIAIDTARKTSQRTQRLVARKLDPREESFELPRDERDEYALRDRFSRD